MRFVSSPRAARVGTVAVAVALAAAFAAQSSAQPGPSEAQGKPQAGDMLVTLLGTGSPVPSATRFGNSTLVQAGGLNLVFDAGRGAAIRLAQAGVPVGEVDGVFITHFHSDHVNGLDDLWLTGYIPALAAGHGQLDLYGPTGVKALAENLTKAFEGDIAARVADGEVDRDTTKLVPYEAARDGIIFDRDGVRVRMFTVDHDPENAIEPAVG